MMVDVILNPFIKDVDCCYVVLLLAIIAVVRYPNNPELGFLSIPTHHTFTYGLFSVNTGLNGIM